MISKRIIPTILTRGRQMVKGVRFDAWRSVGLAAQAVRVHQLRGVDELVLLDIAATAEGRGPDLELVSELSTDCFMPLAVGGGVRSLEQVIALLRAGADKVVIGSAALEQPYLVTRCARVVGSQAIVVALDVAADGTVRSRNGHHHPPEPLCGPALSVAAFLAARGAGELLLTSISREGTLAGYDLELIHRIAPNLPIPVIAHGGCGSYEHMREAIEAGADAVAAGAMFQFTDQTPEDAARYLAEHGIETRIRA